MREELNRVQCTRVLGDGCHAEWVGLCNATAGGRDRGMVAWCKRRSCLEVQVIDVVEQAPAEELEVLIRHRLQ